MTDSQLTTASTEKLLNIITLALQTRFPVFFGTQVSMDDQNNILRYLK